MRFTPEDFDVTGPFGVNFGDIVAEQANVRLAEMLAEHRVLVDVDELIDACQAALNLLRSIAMTEHTPTVSKLRSAIANAKGET